MELVAAAAGGAWTDRPLCTSPVLAHVARTVNDHTSAQARPHLAPLIPYLISVPGHVDDIQADLATSLAVLAAARPRLAADLADALTEQLHRAAVQRPRRIVPTRRQHQFLSITNLALRAIRDNVNPADSDRALRELLVNAINAQRAVERLVPLVSPPGITATAGSIVVLARLVEPPGADWLELEVSANPRRFPEWLRFAWQQRQSELCIGGATSAQAFGSG
jgi:hypothetical protein